MNFRRIYSGNVLLTKFALLVLLGTTSSCAHAIQRDGISASLGGFYSTIDSGIGSTLIGGNTERQGSASFESDLLLEETSTQPIVKVNWNFKEQHMLSLSYFELDRQGAVITVAEFPIGDREFKAGTLLSTELDLNLWQLRYGYAVHQDKVSEWAVTGGLHFISFDVNFNGTVATANNGGGSLDISAGTGFNNTVPLPNVGTYYNYNFSNNFRARFDAQYFNISIDNLDARMVSLEAGVEYFATPKTSLYTGLSYYDVDAKYTQNLGDAVDINWDISLKYWGPMIAVGYQF